MNKIKGEQNILKKINDLPPSSSESDMNVSCMDSGAKTLYFSSIVVVVVVVISCSVTTFRVSTTEMYPSLWAIDRAVCPFCNRLMINFTY